ncbi:hypothetical protein C8J56DRAFT_14506 [Mycena floridula]|nr:hypothetical protein C8J56DRAFT_14506 [Mycena floridula]
MAMDLDTDEDESEPGLSESLNKAFREPLQTHKAAMKHHLRDKLEVLAKAGQLAAEGQVISLRDKFAGSVKWNTYLATLRRHGKFSTKKGGSIDFNSHILEPFTDKIQKMWRHIIAEALFKESGTAIMAKIEDIVNDMVLSTEPYPGLNYRAQMQGAACVKKAQCAVDRIIKRTTNALVLGKFMDVWRSLAQEHIKDRLAEGYNGAINMTSAKGERSFARRREFFHDFIEENKEILFSQVSSYFFDRLEREVDAMYGILHREMLEQAKKVETRMSVLWERKEAMTRGYNATTERRLKQLLTGIVRRQNAEKQTVPPKPIFWYSEEDMDTD